MTFAEWHSRFNSLTRSLQGKPVDEVKAAWAAFFLREHVHIDGWDEDEAADHVSPGIGYKFT
jgi:hypothetical protein